jgi:hypothetical protein
MAWGQSGKILAIKRANRMAMASIYKAVVLVLPVLLYREES